jgi:hypothetical protein
MKLSFPKRAFTHLQRSWSKRRFDVTARKILNTEPLPQLGDSPLFISMVCHRDLVSYLLAIKSLYMSFGHGKVLVINDGSLTSSDLGIIAHHVPRAELIELKDIRVGSCPRADFFWERLVKIVELSTETYVIQIDADTLASGQIPEVIQCWRDNTSFLLGTGSGRAVSSASETAKLVQGWIEKNGWKDVPVYVEAEASLDKLPGAAQRLYVHASAGFAGFARGAFKMRDLEWFSSIMSQILGGQRWTEYGSEQVASNYILANAPGATVLPFPRYACFEPQLESGDHAFLHFIGTYRYDNGVYRRRAAEFLSAYTGVRS